MPQEHRRRQYRRQRIGYAEPGDVGSRAVDGLEYAGSGAADAGTRQHAYGAGDHAGLVGQDVAEHVARRDDVELPGGTDKLHRAVVDIHERQRHVGPVRGHGLGGLAPQTARFEDVRLVDDAEPARPAPRRVEGYRQQSGYLRF